MCLALKALHVQEERDRLRLELNELEERVNPIFILSRLLLPFMLCALSKKKVLDTVIGSSAPASFCESELLTFS